MVERICREKLDAALTQFPEDLVQSHRILCADTLVSLDHHRLGKPKDAAEARQFLEVLSGTEHQVLTGIALWHPASGTRRAAIAGAPARNPRAGPAAADAAGRPELLGTVEYAVSVSHVRFACLSEADIDWYVATEEWRNAAGGYRIQGKAACLIQEIRGSWTGIMGLPLELVYRMVGLA
jgi:septum formation protein